MGMGASALRPIANVAAGGRWGAGGLDPLLSLAFSRHNETHRQAARALSNLSLSQETRDLMVQRGAVKVFVSLAAATNMDVSRLAVPALAALAEAHTTALVDAGAVPTFLSVMRSVSRSRSRAHRCSSAIATNRPKIRIDIRILEF